MLQQTKVSLIPYKTYHSDDLGNFTTIVELTHTDNYCPIRKCPSYLYTHIIMTSS